MQKHGILFDKIPKTYCISAPNYPSQGNVGVEIIVMVIVSRGGSQCKGFLIIRELILFLASFMCKSWWKSFRGRSGLWAGGFGIYFFILDKLVRE